MMAIYILIGVAVFWFPKMNIVTSSQLKEHIWQITAPRLN